MFIKDLSTINQAFKLSYEQAKVLIANGKQVNIEVSEFKAKRSNEQNNYYWLFCSNLSKFFYEVGLSYGDYKIPYTSEIIHEINKVVFGVKTTTKMKVNDFCDYMLKVMIFWNEKTCGEFQMSELPADFLQRKGYTQLENK